MRTPEADDEAGAAGECAGHDSTSRPAGLAGYAGLLQRVFVVLVMVWTVAVAVSL